jgi:hypothetical protein
MLVWPDAAFAAIGASRIPVGYKFVSPEYFDVFAIPIVRGRSFTAAERDGESHGSPPHAPPASIRSDAEAGIVADGG